MWQTMIKKHDKHKKMILTSEQFAGRNTQHLLLFQKSFQIIFNSLNARNLRHICMNFSYPSQSQKLCPGLHPCWCSGGENFPPFQAWGIWPATQGSPQGRDRGRMCKTVMTPTARNTSQSEWNNWPKLLWWPELLKEQNFNIFGCCGNVKHPVVLSCTILLPD